MTLEVAKNAGFCYGVKRAIELAEEMSGKYSEICTLGLIIHNKQVTQRLEKQGITAVDSVSKAKGHVIIRAHGVPKAVTDELLEKNISYTDATCPFVSKIHKIVYEKSSDGFIVIIIGDEKHPEVEGTKGHAAGKCYIADNKQDLQNILDNLSEIDKNKVIMVSQTTFNSRVWEEIKEFTKKLYTNVQIFDTICNATDNRQNEAQRLAGKSDLVIVVGDLHSSNTKKLEEICSKYCRTVHIEKAEELTDNIILGLRQNAHISITAGASTPADIIKEVTGRMSEILGNNEELSFEQLLNESLQKKINIGDRVKATVVAIRGNEVVVDVGSKYSGYIALDELTNTPGVKPGDILAVGDVFDAIVLSSNDAEGFVTLSKKRVDAAKGMETLIKASDEGTSVEATVTAVVNGGIIVVSNGVRVFVPASQSGTRRDTKLDELLHKQVKIKIIEINEARGRVVGSIKLAYKEQNEESRNKFWLEAEEGKKYDGVVKSIESYGVFVDLGGVDGMVHVSELTWSRIRHPKEVVKIGDAIKVYIKSIDREKKRISLGAKDPDSNPWDKFTAEYKAGDKVSVKIMSITPFGAFAQIIPGVDGLIHISQISTERISNAHDILKIGQEVEAVITEINTENNRISLSVRALLEEAKAKEQSENLDVKIEGVEVTTDNSAE